MKKLNKLTGILLAAVMLLMSTACKTADKPQEEKQVSDGMHTIIDHLDNEVKIPDKIERIAVCDILPLPSVLTVFFDSADKIVGMTPPSMAAAKNGLLSEIYPGILNAKTNFIDGTNVNIEELMKLNPDVVFYSASSKDEGDKLKGAGFNAVAVSASKWDYDAIETLNHWIELLGQIFLENDKPKSVKDYSNKVYDMVQERVANIPETERQKVFFLFQYSDSTMMTSGKHFFGQWWADAIGAKNAAEELINDNSVAVNMEQVYAWNPSLIFITNFTTAKEDDIYNNTIGNYNWSEVDAVKNRNVHKMPLGMYRSYTAGADTPITLMWLAKTAYPQIFSDIDITAETKKYYKEVFGVELTDEQANKIFAPSVDAGKVFK